jgi:hypothetical protein
MVACLTFSVQFIQVLPDQDCGKREGPMKYPSLYFIIEFVHWNLNAKRAVLLQEI